MVKNSLTILGSCLCLIFSLQTNILYAASQGNPATMQAHIEKAKLKNPVGYQEMVDRAGGNITSCVSCHLDMNKKKNSPGQTTPK